VLVYQKAKEFKGEYKWQYALNVLKK
jgi:hypothetical protein